MKIVVTGGAGFIGSHIVDAYVADGHDVTVIDNLSTGKESNLNEKADFIATDVSTPEVIAILKKIKPDVINHHAAQIDVRRSVADPHFDMTVNIGGIVNIIEAAKETKPQKIIFASSGGTVYGEQLEFPATESHSLHPLNPYGINKLTSEHYLYYLQKNFNVPYVALRYANIYGPRQNPHGEAGVIAIFIKKLLKNEPITINGDGNQTRDYVFVKDVAAINRLAVSKNLTGAYNVGNGIELSVNDVCENIQKILRNTQVPHHGPAKIGEPERSSLDATKIRKAIDVPQTSFEQGLTETLSWFQTQTNQ